MTDRPSPRTLLVPWRTDLVLPEAGETPKLQPAHQANEADPQQYAGSDESPDIGAVQRLYTRLAQIIQEHHRSPQRQHQTGKPAAFLHALSSGPHPGPESL